MLFKTIFKFRIWFFAATMLILADSRKSTVSMIPDGPYCVILGVKCYEFATEGRNWFQAEAYCRRNHGYLATIMNNVEMDLITKHLLAHDIHDWIDFWIDGTDLADEGTFRWIRTGDNMAYTKWRAEEPSNKDGKEHCVEVHKQSSDVIMNDNVCAVKRSSICEYDLE